MVMKAVVILALFGVSQAATCDVTNLGFEFSECSVEGNRTAFFYYMEGCTEDYENEPAPKPYFGLPCNDTCPDG